MKVGWKRLLVTLAGGCCGAMYACGSFVLGEVTEESRVPPNLSPAVYALASTAGGFSGGTVLFGLASLIVVRDRKGQ